MVRRCLLVPALVLVACAHATVARSPAPPAPPPAPAAETKPAPPAVQSSVQTELEKTRALVAEVTRLRGLPEKHPLQIEVSPHDHFKEVVLKTVDRDLTDQGLRRELATWLAFGFVQGDIDLRRTLEDVFAEQIAGFYDPKTKTLHVPDGPLASTPPGTPTDIILVHEIEHGLQDQSFGIPDDDEPPDADDELARTAMFEGDATFVMMAWALAKNPNAPPGITPDVILPAARAIDARPASDLIALSGKSDSLLAAPLILREAMMFPYFKGLRLIAELYHTGGYALVNRAFAAPPTTTQQILHPEKYLAGRQPVPIDPPPVPAGEKEVTRGRLGELGVRTFLTECLGEDRAGRVADGWAGDAYLVTERSDGKYALSWSTVWDSPESAQGFADALRELNGCWRKASAKSPSRMAGNLVFKVRGTHVSAVRRDHDAARIADTLLDLPKAPLPDAPPLGPVSLSMAPPAPSNAPSSDTRIEGQVWSNDRIGLSGPIPEGFDRAPDQPGTVISFMRRPPRMSIITIGAFPLADNAQVRSLIYGQFRDAVVGKIASSDAFTPIGDRDVQVGGIDGHFRGWRVAGRDMSIGAIAVPLCGGKALMMIGEVWQSPSDYAELSTWSQGMMLSRVETSPFCADVRSRAESAP